MLDIVSSGDNLQEKSKLYLLEKYKKFSLFPPYFYVPVTELSYEGGSNSIYEKYIYKKNNKKKTLIKSLLFQKSLPNLAILSVYILFNSVYV